jgi:ketosteroid isomerase-like protein
MGPEDFLKNYESALATQDWQAVAPFIHQDACVTFSNGLAFFGKTQVQQAFEDNFALIQEEQHLITDCFLGETDKPIRCLLVYIFHPLLRLG